MATDHLLYVLALLNVALILTAFTRRFLKYWYFQLRDRRRLVVAAHVDNALREIERGNETPAPRFLWLAEDDLLRRIPVADEKKKEQLRDLYRAWGLAALRGEELQRRRGHRPGEAAIAVARMGIREAALPITQLLRGYTHQVRLAALRALEVLGAQKATPPLMDVLPEVKDTARILAAAALASSCRSRPELLLPHLTHEDDPIRAIVAGAMAEVATPAVVPGIQPYVRDPYPEVRARIAEAFGTAADPKALPLLKELAKDSVWSVRIEAVAAMGRLGDYDAFETLSAAVHDSDWRVRRGAAAALSNLAPEPLGTLTALRRSGDRYATEAMVAELERPGIIWEAINNLNSPSPDLRASSQLLVQELLQARAYGAIFYALEMHPSDEIRHTLLEMFDLFFHREDREQLTPLLESRFLEPDTRRALENIALPAREKSPSKFSLLLTGLGIGVFLTLLAALRISRGDGDPAGSTS